MRAPLRDQEGAGDLRGASRPATSGYPISPPKWSNLRLRPPARAYTTIIASNLSSRKS